MKPVKNGISNSECNFSTVEITCNTLNSPDADQRHRDCFYCWKAGIGNLNLLAVLALYLLAQQEGFGISNHGLKEKDQDLIKPSHVRSDDDDEGDEAAEAATEGSNLQTESGFCWT